MRHVLKCWPEFFDAVDRGTKTFEVRKDDRGFQVGDEISLQRFRPGVGTSRDGEYVNLDDTLSSPWFEDGVHAEIRLFVTYKLPGGRFGIDPNWCVLGFRKVSS